MAIYEDHADYAVRAWLQEPIQLPEEGRTAVARRIRETPQRRHRWPTFTARRSPTMFSATRLVVVGIVLAIVSGTLLFGLVGPRRSTPVAPPAASSEAMLSSTSPEASPSPSPRAVAIATSRLFQLAVAAVPAGTNPYGVGARPDGPTAHRRRPPGRW